MANSDTIWRDKHGVCHVEGKDKTEAFGLMGYAHGKDRGMQILLMRILGQGRASELLDSSDEGAWNRQILQENELDRFNLFGNRKNSLLKRKK